MSGLNSKYKILKMRMVSRKKTEAQKFRKHWKQNVDSETMSPNAFIFILRKFSIVFKWTKKSIGSRILMPSFCNQPSYSHITVHLTSYILNPSWIRLMAMNYWKFLCLGDFWKLNLILLIEFHPISMTWLGNNTHSPTYMGLRTSHCDPPKSILSINP